MIYRWILELRIVPADVNRDADPEARTLRELAEADIAEADFADFDPVIRTEVEFEQSDPDPDTPVGDLEC